MLVTTRFKFRSHLLCLALLTVSLWVPVVWAQDAGRVNSAEDVEQSQQDIAARAINLLSFVALDYPEATEGGASRDRRLYRQLRGNVAVASELLRRLPERPGRAQLANSLQELDALIADKRAPELIRQRANAAADRIAALYQVPRAPAEMLPPGEEAIALYQDRCSQCHGVSGVAPESGRSLDDPQRMAKLSLYDLYNALEPTRNDAHGQAIDGDLSNRQRWALAVLVAGFSAPELAPNAELAEKYPALVGVPGAAIVRPASMPEEAGQALMWWRAHPQQTRYLQHPLARAAGLLYTAQSAYRGGDYGGAYHQLMLAMREGLAQSRPELEKDYPALTAQLDQQWQELRQAILDQAPTNEVIEKFQRLQANVVRAREDLQPTSGRSIYGWAAVLFLTALGVGLLLWLGLRRPRS